MRPFGALALKMLTMAVPMVQGAATGEWDTALGREPKPKAEVLRLWDESTAQLAQVWGRSRPNAFSRQ